MEIEYKRDLTSTTMIIRGINLPLGYRGRMVEENNIPCLLSCSVINSGGYVYRYDISGKKSLRGFFVQEGISRDTLLIGFKAILNGLFILEDYLLAPNEILLDIDRIFLDNKGYDRGAYFVYTGQAADYNKGLLSIMEYIVENIDTKEEETVAICYKLYERVNIGNITIGEMVESISEADTKNKQTYNAWKLQSEIEQAHSAEDYINAIDKDRCFIDEPVYFQERIEEKSILVNFINKFIHKFRGKKDELFPRVSDIDNFIMEPEHIEEYIEPQTALISGLRLGNRSLIYLGRENYQDIDVDKEVIKIGSRVEACDFVIESKAVSRVHAVVSLENEIYYIQDMESKNGTYINENILPPNTKAVLNVGDIVSFANISYRFS